MPDWPVQPASTAHPPLIWLASEFTLPMKDTVFVPSVALNMVTPPIETPRLSAGVASDEKQLLP